MSEEVKMPHTAEPTELRSLTVTLRPRVLGSIQPMVLGAADGLISLLGLHIDAAPEDGGMRIAIEMTAAQYRVLLGEMISTLAGADIDTSCVDCGAPGAVMPVLRSPKLARRCADRAGCDIRTRQRAKR